MPHIIRKGPESPRGGVKSRSVQRREAVMAAEVHATRGHHRDWRADEVARSPGDVWQYGSRPQLFAGSLWNGAPMRIDTLFQDVQLLYQVPASMVSPR